MRSKNAIFLILILFFLFLLRFPSLFEPNWYGDEGIFAAVAHNLTRGGILYQTAWDNKPPLIYLLYAGIFKLFGPEQFYLRLAALLAVLATSLFIFLIVKKIASPRRGLWAALIFGILVSTPLIEGNLALTEIFMILPICGAFFLFLKSTQIKGRQSLFLIFLAGFLLALASLTKQIAVLEAAALGVFLLFQTNGNRENLKKIFCLVAGFAVPYLFFLVIFFIQGTIKDFIFASYTYYLIYLKESPSLPFYLTLLKFVPPLSMTAYLFYQKRERKISSSSLIYLWLGFSILGVFFSGRSYPHYSIEVLPPLAIFLATIKIQRPSSAASWAWAFFLVPIIIFWRMGSPGISFFPDPLRFSYYQNFVQFLAGARSVEEYNNYFDRNVNKIILWRDFLRESGAAGKTVYIWGDYPWLYVLTDVKNPVRYVTSFHVFGVPNGENEVIKKFEENKPFIIVRDNRAIGNFGALNLLILKEYREIATIGTAEFFRLK